MSDPMTNTEVEDVLASIRRLVSDDKRPELKPAPKAPSDRLVLTPSLRVMEDDSTGAPEADEPDAQAEEDQQSTQAEHDYDDDDHDNALSEFAESAFSKSDQDDDHHESGQDADGPFGDDDDDMDASHDMQAEDMADEHEMMDRALEASDTSDDTLVLGEAEEDTAAADDDADEDIEIAADAQDEDAGDADTATVPEDWADEALADTADAEQPVDEAEDMASIAEDDTAEKPEPSLSEKIAALEMMVGKRSENFEPDDPGADAYAGTEQPAMEWEDADEAPEYAAYVEAKPKREEEPASQIFSSDEDVLDEDALRELVSDIVREELQGALGERITRNVRKLVRREIHRALAAQELE